MVLNLELIVKLIYFSPITHPPSAVNFIHQLLGYDRLKKTGIFALYCVALKIQEEQTDCISNLVPIFSD
jgi:hypothetical protein